jgi:hypothetical protein
VLVLGSGTAMWVGTTHPVEALCEGWPMDMHAFSRRAVQTLCDTGMVLAAAGVRAVAAWMRPGPA